MEEVNLYDSFGDLAAVSVSLEDVAALAKSICTNSNNSVNYKDYDDYGCEHFVLIEGKCANIKIEKDYGGMFCPENYLKCSVIEKSGYDLDSDFSPKNRYRFVLKNDVEEFSIYKNYEQSLRDWLNANKKYLKADKDLFVRIDSIEYPDLRGVNKWGNGTTSFDEFVVNDEDFYIGDKIRLDVNRKLL